MARIIKFNGNVATGIASPKFPVQQAVQNRDPDLFIDMLAHHPEHIQRSIEKRNRILEDIQKKEQEKKRREYIKDGQMITLGFLSAASILVALFAVAMLL